MRLGEKRVLYFHGTKENQEMLQLFCAAKGVRLRVASMEEERVPLGLLAGAKDWMNPLLMQNSRPLQDLTEEMLVLGGFGERELDDFLAGLRSLQIRIPLKAVLTEQNAVWNAMQLQGELRQEREAFLKSSR